MSYQLWQEISSYLDEIDKVKTDCEARHTGQESLELARRSMMNLLDNLRASLEKQIDKHHSALVMFAIVASIDEKMQSYSFTSQMKWIPLQKDMYSAYTAGEVFFTSIDEILDDSNTPNIVYQVYYAMLRRGFQGKYQDSKTQINKYMEMLKDKIPVAATQAKVEHVQAHQPKKKRAKAWHYYGASAALALFLFCVLFFVSNF